MAIASALILWSGRGLAFTGDELYYYARLVDHAGGTLEYDGLGSEYLFAPHNGHLQVVGRLVYEAVFALAGPSYVVLRVLALIGVLVCVGLFYELARRRVDAGLAVAASVLILFLGSAWEVMLWPFDLHTVYSVAFGLGALLAIGRKGRRSDAIACALLCLSVATIELGLAFVAGVGVGVIARRDRLSRIWIVLVPLLGYLGWRIWAQRFDQSELAFSNISNLPASVFDSLTAVVASLTGLIGLDSFPQAVAPLEAATLVAILVAVALLASTPVAGRRSAFWCLAATLLAYWAFVAIGARDPDSSRYMFAGAILLLLVGAEALRGGPRSGWVVAALGAVAAVAIPFNIAKLQDGRTFQLADGSSGRMQYAMLELARERVDPAYAPGFDPEVRAAGPQVSFGLNAGDYLAASERVGSFAFSLGELGEQPRSYRKVADVTLARALALGLEPAARPPERGSCGTVTSGVGTLGEALELDSGTVALRSLEVEREIALARFSPELPSFSLGSVPTGSWVELNIPDDASAVPWRLFASGPVRHCASNE